MNRIISHSDPARIGRRLPAMTELGMGSAVRPALHGYQVLGFAAKTSAKMRCFSCGRSKRVEGIGIRRRHGRIAQPLFNGCQC